jgi:hypothetical protein
VRRIVRTASARIVASRPVRDRYEFPERAWFTWAQQVSAVPLTLVTTPHANSPGPPDGVPALSGLSGTQQLTITIGTGGSDRLTATGAIKPCCRGGLFHLDDEV